MSMANYGTVINHATWHKSYIPTPLTLDLVKPYKEMKLVPATVSNYYYVFKEEILEMQSRHGKMTVNRKLYKTEG